MGASKLKPVDIVVIGVGVAGSIMCKELAETGLSVVGLERGRMLDPQHDFAMPYVHDELKYDNRDSELLQNLSRETITFRNAPNESALPLRQIVPSFKPGECVGGAGVHWAGTSLRFLPWDFEMRSRTIERYGKSQLPDDCTSQDWGVTYEELEPYYDQFEHLYGIGGKAGNLNGEIQSGGNPFEGARSREFPNPPAASGYCGALFAQAASSLGYHPFPKPSAGMTRPYVNPYRLMLGQCIQGGYCGSYGCATGAKATPLTAVVPALLKHENFELRPLANAIRINLDSRRKRAVSVSYMDARGRELEQPADLVILASFVFGNARLMLLSGIGEPYDPIDNRGVIGRNYASQVSSKVTAFFENRVFNPFAGGGGRAMTIDDFNGDNFDHSGERFVGGGYISERGREATPINTHPVPPGTPAWGSEWKKAVAHYYQRSVAVGCNAGCQSYRTNYLSLDPNYRDAHGLPLVRLTMDWHDNERELSAFMVSRESEIAEAMGADQVAGRHITGQYNIMSSGNTHTCGGVIMGADPATSAVNKYLQSWDVPNVFVVGGSAFPQNGGNNPTATIGALACWSADAIKERYLKQPGSLI